MTKVASRVAKPVTHPMPKMDFLKPFAGTHGIKCYEYKVLVQPIETKKATAGGIILPDETHERDEHATMEGTVAGMSPLAFSYDENAPKPEIGETIIFQRFAGHVIFGADGIKYRVMNDKDVFCGRTA